MKKLFFIILPFLIISGNAWARVSVSASLDPPEMILEDDSTITVSVAGASSSSDPVAPHVQGLEIIKTGRTSQIQIVNGQMSITAEFIYKVIASDAGTFTIPPFRVYSGGVGYKSNSLRLKVAKGARAPNVYQQPHPQQMPSDMDPKFWISTSVNNKSPYYSQQILFTLKLYTRENITQAVPILPEFHDFLTEVIVQGKQGKEMINGRSYATWEKVIALIPLKQGQVTIGKAGIDIAYQVTQQSSRRRNRWDPFFNFNFGLKQTKQTKLSAPAIDLNVRPLPQPIPKDFTNLVGQFGIQSKLSDNEIEAGESVTLEIHLSGQGNIKEGSLPDIKLPGFKIYKDKPTVEMFQSAKGISGKKIFKMALVATEDGVLPIPAFDLSYFDPKTSQYVLLHIDEKKIYVLPAKEETVNPVITQIQTQNGGQKVIYQDIAPVFSEGEKVLLATPIRIHSAIFYAIVWGMPLAFITLMVARSMRNGSKKPSKRNLQKTAYQELLHQLKHSHSSEDEILESVRTYMAAVFDVRGRALTAKDMRDLCLENGIDKKIATRMGQAIEDLEAVQYGFDQEAAIGSAVKELKGVIGEIQKVVRRV